MDSMDYQKSCDDSESDAGSSGAGGSRTGGCDSRESGSKQEQEQKQKPGTSGTSHSRVSRPAYTHSPTAEGLRLQFRDRFFARIRASRNRSVDRLRQIVEDYGDELQYTSQDELRLALRNDPEGSSLMGYTEVIEFLQEVEAEVGQAILDKEVRQHEQEEMLETDDIVNRHLDGCKLCSQPCPEEICPECRLTIEEIEQD
nr:unnamed protein product [Callosobruchus chinensis]